MEPAWLEWLGGALSGDRSALSPPPPHSGQLLHALDQHGVLPSLHIRLREDPLWKRLDPGFQDGLTYAFQAAALRAMYLDTELARVVGALSARAIPVCLLKGLALTHLVYDSLAERPVADFDLLIPAEYAVSGLQAVTPLGYTCTEWAPTGWAGRSLRRFRSELAFIGQAPGRFALIVELHWSLLDIPYYREQIKAEEIWSRTAPVQSLPGAFMPDAAILMVHACAHMAYHHSRNLKLMWLVDVDRLGRLPKLDWASVVATARDWRLSLAVKTTLEAAIHWTGMPAPRWVIDELATGTDTELERRLWGVGDEPRRRGLRRASTSWNAFDWAERARFAAYLGSLVLAWPMNKLYRVGRSQAR